VEDALGVMVKAYARMGLDELHNDAVRVLELNYPDSSYLN
jgi:outer membrane protein assembly factor BamD (BamD/ComL family)